MKQNVVYRQASPCDTTAAVRIFLKPLFSPEHPNSLPFVSKMQCLLRMRILLLPFACFEFLHFLKRNIKQTFRTMEISCSKFNITHKKSKYLLLKNHNLLLLRNKSLQFHLYTVILIFPPHLGQKCFFQCT